MVKIKLRTKFEIIGALLFIALLVAISAESVTRTITDSTDNSYTLIRNSKGNYWAATGANLQTAINDLGSGGGTVWVGSDITLSSALNIGNYTIVDFEGHNVILGSDVSFINLTGGVWYSTIRNVNVKISNGQTKDVICLYAPPGMGWAYRKRFNLFENINIINSYANNYAWTGIHLYLHVGVNNPNGRASMVFNTFRKITMNDCKTGILLGSDNCDAYGGGNSFDDILIDGYTTGVEFKINPSAIGLGFSESVFNHVKLQTAARSTDGFCNITGNDNHFDHCLIWDWYAATSPNHEWSITNRADQTYINADYMSDLSDAGTDTNIVNPHGITDNYGATVVADGGTISHGLKKTPTVVVCTCSVSGQMVSVTALGSTTFTVAIKKPDGTAGTTQKIYWHAWA